MTLPTTPLARIARIRAGARLDDDLDAFRIVAQERRVGWAGGSGLICDCRCHCHLNRCGYPIDLDTMDCARSCRASHYLAADCTIDENRSAGVHV